MGWIHVKYKTKQKESRKKYTGLDGVLSALTALREKQQD